MRHEIPKPAPAPRIVVSFPIRFLWGFGLALVANALATALLGGALILHLTGGAR